RVIAISCLAFYGVSNFSSEAQQSQQAQQAQQGGQQARPTPTPTPINQSDDPVLKNFRWRSIGPASMGGRIDDIVAVESNPYLIYVGVATGGGWKTVNNGKTWEPVFEPYPTSSSGDTAGSQPSPTNATRGT